MPRVDKLKVSSLKERTLFRVLENVLDLRIQESKNLFLTYNDLPERKFPLQFAAVCFR